MTINNAGLETAPRNSAKPVHVEKTRRDVYDPIAVIGMGCRLPGESNSPHALWKLLERGGIARNEPPASRFDLKTHHDGSGKPNTMGSPGGMFLENIDPQEFDAAFFSVSAADAIGMDPQQRQLLEVVYECLENAGVTLESLDGAAVACLVGSYAVGAFSASWLRDTRAHGKQITRTCSPAIPKTGRRESRSASGGQC